MVNGTDGQGAASVIQKSGAGRMVLSGNNTYTGGTILNAGTLVAASKSALGATHGTPNATYSNSVNFNTVTGTGNTNAGVMELATADGTLTNLYNVNMGSDRYNSIIVNRDAATPGSADYGMGVLSLGSSTMTFTKGANVTGIDTARISFSELRLTAGNNDREVTLNGDSAISIGSASITSTGISKRLQLDGTSQSNTIGAISDTNNSTAGAKVNLIKANSSIWTLSGREHLYR